MGAATSKVVKVGVDEELWNELTELARKKGDIKASFEEALRLYTALHRGSLVVRVPVGGGVEDVELVDIEMLSNEDIVGYEFYPLYERFTPNSIRKFVELGLGIAEEDFEENPAVMVKKPELTSEDDFWFDAERDLDKLVSYVLDGFEVKMSVKPSLISAFPGSMTVSASKVVCV